MTFNSPAGERKRAASTACRRAFQGADCLVGARARQHDGHLLAAVAGDEIALSGRLAEDPRRAPQHFVAGLVPVGVVEVLEMINVAENQREGPVRSLEVLEVGGHLVVEGPAVGQAREGVGAGLGGFHLHEARLLMELVLHGAELRLHQLVGLDQPRNGRDHALGLVDLAPAQLLVDLSDPGAVPPDVGRHVAGQFFQPAQNLLGQALFFRQFYGRGTQRAMQQPPGPHSPGTRQDRKRQIAKYFQHIPLDCGALSARTPRRIANGRTKTSSARQAPHGKPRQSADRQTGPIAGVVRHP